MPEFFYRKLDLHSSLGVSVESRSYLGEDYLIIPVVALVGNSIVRPSGSKGKEFVPLEVLADYPFGWNGRPITYNHPNDYTANTPEFLESNGLGIAFNSRIEKESLSLDAWVSVSKADKIGCNDLVESAKIGRVVSVSVGLIVAVEEIKGSYKGDDYDFIWKYIVSTDHIAILPIGWAGACSIEMGCGAPRKAQQFTKLSEEIPTTVTASAPASAPIRIQSVTLSDKKGGNLLMPSVLSKLLSMVSPQTVEIVARQSLEDEGAGIRELENTLAALLREVEPGFEWVVNAFPESQTVVYYTYPKNEMLLWRRSYNIDGDGVISLNDDRERVKRSDSFETIKAAESGTETDATIPGDNQENKSLQGGKEMPCTCGANKSVQGKEESKGQEVNKALSEEPKVNNKFLRKLSVSKLIKAGLFSEGDRSDLEGLDEDTFSKIESSAGQLEPVAAHVNETPKVEVKKNSSDNWLDNVPEGLKNTLLSLQAQQDSAKDLLVKKLSVAQDVFSVDDLKAMEVELLRKLEKLHAPSNVFGGIDYSLVSTGTESSEGEPKQLSSPDTYGLKAKNLI